MKLRCLQHNVAELISIGRDIVSSPAKASNTSHEPSSLKQIYERFKYYKSNFRLMCNELAESPDPARVLFTRDGTSLRPAIDILHLFLCIHEFYDGFGGFLLDMMREAVLKPVEDPSHRVLLWAMYLLVLLQDKDFRALQTIVEKPPVDKNPRLIVSASQELFPFCKAIQDYASGIYLVRAPWLKDRIDEDLFERREKALSGASDGLNRKHLSSESLYVRKYFTIYVKMAEAEAMKQTRPRSPDVIGKAFNICRAAKKELEKVPVLEPV